MCVCVWVCVFGVWLFDVLLRHMNTRDNHNCRSPVACGTPVLQDSARPGPRHQALLGNSPPGAGELVLARGVYRQGYIFL